MFLFSKQVDSLYNEISEFDKCFPESSFAIWLFFNNIHFIILFSY
jgi:hypothetical protein